MTPIVLHHGLFGYDRIEVGRFRMSYFLGIDQAIAGRGHPLIVSRVHPTAGVAFRAKQLKETITEQLNVLGQPKQKVVIIAHSMGGLDARYMISRLGMEDRVAALVTITSPHHGSPYADWCVRHLGQRLGGFQLMNLLNLNVQALNDLTTETCQCFNEAVPNVPDVQYYSVSAERPWHRVPPFALHAYKCVYDREGPNDGLVSVKSAHWGEHLATWPADHWHTINRRLVLEIKNPTGNIVPYYMKVLDHLKDRGAIVADG